MISEKPQQISSQIDLKKAVHMYKVLLSCVFNNITDEEEGGYRMMIAGLRGVGKSSLANSISGKHVQVSKNAFETVTKKSS